ncbi:MAG: alpha/beta hydrolase family protein [Acidimicrobiia bacterium]
MSVAAGCGSGDTNDTGGESSGVSATTLETPTAPSTTSSTTTTTVRAGTPATTSSSESNQPSSTESTEAPTSTMAPDVGMAWTVIDVVDDSRTTAELPGPDGSVILAASPTRTIPTVLLYPGRSGGGEAAPAAQVEPRPLVVWLNGLGGRATAGDPLLLALYEAGYVVAAPNVPEIAEPVAHPAGYVHQPADVSAVIDALAAPDGGVPDGFAAVVDTERIGVVGHSIGGSGVYGAAFHDCCRDERIAAAVVLAAPRFDFDGGEFRFSGVPLLIVHGSADQIIALEQSEMVRNEAEDAVLAILNDADHFQPVYGLDRSDVLALTEELLRTFLDVHVAGTASPDDFTMVLERSADRISAR